MRTMTTLHAAGLEYQYFERAQKQTVKKKATCSEYVIRSELQSLLSTLAEMSDDSDVEAMLEAPFIKDGAEVRRY